MSYAENPYRSWGQTAADAQPSERADFIKRTYLHLGAAVLGFTALEAVLLNIPGVEQLIGAMMGGRLSWMVVLGAFMVVSWVADSWAQSSTSLTKQYAGLGLYVVAEAVIFLPMLYIAERMSPDIIPEAGIITLVLFGGLTAIVAVSKVDFSFLRLGLTIAGFASLGIIVCSAIFGFNLGIVFTGAMLVLASGYILYHTSNVLHVYRTDQYVAAALALFASVALLFWYVLRLLMEMNGREIFGPTTQCPWRVQRQTDGGRWAARRECSMDSADYDPRYLEGIEHFNVCDFYESHEVWEALWADYQGPSRKFFQGLIQAAVALHHFGNGNIRGARKLYHSTLGYLKPYGPVHMGIDLEKFLAEFHDCFTQVLASDEEFPQIEIEPDRIPEIHLDPACH